MSKSTTEKRSRVAYRAPRVVSEELVVTLYAGCSQVSCGVCSSCNSGTNKLACCGGTCAGCH